MTFANPFARALVPALFVAAVPAAAAESPDMARLNAHIRSVHTMTANFTQTDARGRSAAAAGLGSELESVLGGDGRYAIAPLPTLSNSRDGWAVGMAVKKSADDLAQALQAAVEATIADRQLSRIFRQGNVTWRPA